MDALEELELVEFGTQTCFDEDCHTLLGMGTQTSPTDLFSHFQPHIDFGTQTIEELFSSAGSYLAPATEVAATATDTATVVAEGCGGGGVYVKDYMEGVDGITGLASSTSLSTGGGDQGVDPLVGSGRDGSQVT